MTVLSRRDKISLLSKRVGLTYALTKLPKRSCLIVLNYHRIGDAASSMFDRGVFSTTAEEFQYQIAFVRDNYRIATIDEAIQFVNGGSPKFDTPLVLITFDDGYLDNYTLAFPILQNLGVHATFFLTSNFVGTDCVPWWDMIAFAIRKTRKTALALDANGQGSVQISTNIEFAILKALAVYKSLPSEDAKIYLANLLEECDVTNDFDKIERLFMDWYEAKLMLEGGMTFGSHTHSHEILSNLSYEDQVREITLSRNLIRDNLGIDVSTLAYPVGGRNAFSPLTMQALQEHGYNAAFSFYGGVNFPGEVCPFDIHRVSMGQRLHHRFEFQIPFACITGFWF